MTDDNQILKIILPYPYRELNPNKHLHWRVKHKFKQAAKAEAMIELQDQHKNKILRIDPVQMISVRLIYPSSKDRGAAPDSDNMAAAIKHYQDGIFSQLDNWNSKADIDDKLVRTTINRVFPKCDDPRVEYYLYHHKAYILVTNTGIHNISALADFPHWPKDW